MNIGGTFIKGMEGELEVKRILNNTEGIKYVENMYLESIRGTCQLDFVVIAKTGLYVVEVKNIVGTVHMNEELSKWKIVNMSYTYSILNPILQNSRHILNLRKALNTSDTLTNLVVFPDKTTLQGDVEEVKPFTHLYSITDLSKHQIYSTEEVDELYIRLTSMKETNRTLAIRHNRNTKRFLRQWDYKNIGKRKWEYGTTCRR